MQQPILNLEERHSLATQRTRLYTKPSPGHPNGHGLFAGLPTRPPRKRLPKPVETLRPGLTPWLNDWVTDLNDLLPPDGFDFDDEDIPDDGFSLGEPEESFNYWEKPWIQAKADKKVAEVIKKGDAAFKRKHRMTTIPLSRVGRKRAWKKRAEGRLEREKGNFIKKEEIIIIGDDR
ncbi:hypothetical protein IFR04_007449 [Cadophora malorum]|uniref:Uncharacterized protein n=1 Tax=Cadophora malorum TaxID=108018 RepID=A0A8H7WAE8_9HELO|nr:hypothetical protein IFR04_007449 [Cadophora malorum]